MKSYLRSLKEKPYLKDKIVLDTETDNKANLILIGIMYYIYFLKFFKIRKYKYFLKVDSFLLFLKEKGIKEVWCLNVEFDFFKIWENKKDLKFTAYYSSAGLSYVQQGRIYWKDIHNHFSFSLAKLGSIINIPKGEINYRKIKEVNKKLLDYNKIDCLITFEVLKELGKIEKEEGLKNIPSTIGSSAFKIFNRSFNRLEYGKIQEKVLNEWRWGYFGGWVEPFKIGKFTNKKFYQIDVNSLFPFVMKFKFPYPYTFHKTKKKEKLLKVPFALGIRKETKECFNSIEHDLINIGCDYYYIFPLSCFPFYEYIKYFEKKKINAKNLLRRENYKRKSNAGYGKFAQTNEIKTITNRITKKKNLIAREEMLEGLFKETVEVPQKYWVNIVWSLFTTAYAREYMRKMKNYIEKQGLIIYYIDTDGFILSGNIKKINKIIDSKKYGKFKIERKSYSIEIKGKKLYRFGRKYKAKGVPKKYQSRFFRKGSVVYYKMVRLKESFRTGKTFGLWVKTEKRNIEN